MATHEMSRIEMELNSMNTASDENSVMTVNESEHKTITAIDELLQQELKEVDPVECFIKRVEPASEDSSEFGLNYDEAPVVSSDAFYSPKEDTSTDNSSLLEKELEDTLNKDKDEILTSDTEKLPSDEEAATVKDNTPVTNTIMESVDESTNQTEDKGEDDIPQENDAESVQIQDKENSMNTEKIDSDVKDQVDNEDSAVEEETKQNETGDEAKENEAGDEDKEKETSDETKEKESGDEIKENEIVDEAMEAETSEETKEEETGDEVQDLTEGKLPSEIPNSDTEQIENHMNNESTQAESTQEAQKEALYLVFHPKEEVNKKNDSEKDNDSPVTTQCSETSTTSNSVVKTITVPSKPVTKKVFSISTGGDAKNGKEINQSIIVKTITARVIKTGNTVTLKPTAESDNCTNEGTPSNTKSSEPEEEPQNKSDNTKEGESEKQTQNDSAAAVKTPNPETILTRKVYGKRKRSPKKGQVPDTEDKDVTNNDTQDHLNNADHDQESVLGNEGKTKTRAGKKIKTLPDKLEVNGKDKDENTERLANCGTLKRKLEEICRISREEEDDAIKEIKKMKKETLVVLKKINAEMEKLKLVFLARK